MSQKETNVLKRVQLKATELGARLFRNQVGHYKLADGRRLTSGLCNGSSDLIGWTPIIITDDMVGGQVAVFTAIEVKTDTGRVQENQQKFIENVLRAGGYAGVARSDEEVKGIIFTHS